MALEVCVGSFYLVFLIAVAIKDTLMFYAIKQGQGQQNYDIMLMFMIIFDLIVLFTLPLAIMGTKAVC